MTDIGPSEQRRGPRRTMRWAQLSLLVTLVMTIVVGAGLLLWSHAATSSYVADKVMGFASVMNVVRPAMLIVMLVLWRPVFSWLHSRSVIADSTHAKAIGVWPRLVIWVALIELTIGQGFVLIGLTATALYWLFVRAR